MIFQFKDFFSRLTTKAATTEGGPFYNYSQYNPYQLITNSYKATIFTPQSLVTLNTNWVNVCINKISNIIATTPLKLYAKKSKSKKILIPHKKADIKQIQRMNIKMTEDQDLVEIVNHPFLDLLNKVNPNMNYTDLISLIQMYLGLIGNAYVLVVKDASGIPIELYPLLSEYVTIRLDKDGNIEGYKYCYNGKDTLYTKDEIIHFINYQPGSIISGRGELEGCLDAVVKYNYYNQRDIALNQNNARPDYVISFKTPLNEQEQKDITNAFHKRFGTIKNAGKPMITSECSVLPISFSPLDMDYKSAREFARSEIINAYGVPESLISLNSANYASASVSHYQFYTYTIIPKLRQMCEKINEKLLPMYDDNLYVWFDQNVEEDKTIQADVLTKYVDSNIMSIDEARQILGMEPKTI